MAQPDIDFVDKVTGKCIKLYNELPKTGKPIENEWTVLSCIVQYDSKSHILEVVSLGTGSKCIGASKMSPSGDILNDSHAEVIARRGFLLYLYDNIDQALEGKDSIFLMENEKFTLKDNIEFIFYSSQLPCGDASIIPQIGEEENVGEVLESLKKPASEDICDLKYKNTRESDDIYRTGAKCLPDAEQDLMLPGKNYHLLGQVRTKPGRGDKTQSVSCSDKIARWVHVGIQGGLLDFLLSKPIFIKYFVFGASVPYSNESLERALLNRNPVDLSKEMQNIVPVFQQSSFIFPHIKSGTNLRPAPGSIVWSKSNSVEVAVQGRKLGLTKKKAKSLGSSLCISKYNIYKRFQNVLYKHEKMKLQIVADSNLSTISYNAMKSKSKSYLDRWNLLKEVFFKCWTKKPDIWNFCIHET